MKSALPINRIRRFGLPRVPAVRVLVSGDGLADLSVEGGIWRLVEGTLPCPDRVVTCEHHRTWVWKWKARRAT